MRRAQGSLEQAAVAETLPAGQSVAGLAETLEATPDRRLGRQDTLAAEASPFAATQDAPPHAAVGLAHADTVEARPDRRLERADTVEAHPDRRLERADTLAGTGTAPPDSQAEQWKESGPSLSTLLPRAVPKDWEAYEVLGLLGRGGMGAVFKARDRRLGRFVALKFIRGDEPHLITRLQQEARAQARIEHPHVCKVYEVGDVAGQAYIAMQFIAGQPLSVVHGGMTLDAKVKTLIAIAEGVQAAHRQGIVHRDLKPANVMMECDETGAWHPYVMDFGLAHDTTVVNGLTQSGALLGTPQYMSPEQARGETRRIDRRSDVYCLGAILYEMLTGRPVFEGSSLAEVLMRVLEQEPTPPRQHQPDVPLDLQTVALKCLHKEAQGRYPSAHELAQDLQRYLDGEPVLARRIGALQRLYLRARKHKPLLAVCCALVLSLVGFLVNRLQVRRESRQREQLAQKQALLAHQMGVEISKMEWMLRSARQLPLHNLEREKNIVRKRMARLQSELSSYGELGRGLGQYALGRGHMALQEYPAALAQLRLAIAAGNQRPEVLYALGFVLGKHHEQAVAEIRLTASGDWARKKIKEIEPQFLLPAIESLQRSQSAAVDSSAYLEGLIAYYRGDYDHAIERARLALSESPWLYEASQLIGDVHKARGFLLMARAQMEPADNELSAAVDAYTEASLTGQSDAQIYEALADTWGQRIAVAKDLGRPLDTPYRAALAAGDKIIATAPLSIVGPLKKAYAMQWRIQGPEPSEALLVTARQCLDQLEPILEKEPQHVLASSVWSACMAGVGSGANKLGQDPTPYYQKAIARMEPIVQRHPYFFEGVQNLAFRYQNLGEYFHRTGRPELRAALSHALDHFAKALSIDPASPGSVTSIMEVHSMLVAIARSPAELKTELERAEASAAACRRALDGHVVCDANRLVAYAAAAERAFRAGEDPQPYLAIVEQATAIMRQKEVSSSEIEQAILLARLIDLATRAGSKQPLAPAIEAFAAVQKRCFGLDEKDPICHILAAQADWLQTDLLREQPKRVIALLNDALEHARLACQHPLRVAAAWQAVAETQLRMAKIGKPRSKLADKALVAADEALARAFALNPNLAAAHTTQAELFLFRANLQGGKDRAVFAAKALASCQLALQSDPLLARETQARVEQAKSWAAK